MGSLESAHDEHVAIALDAQCDGDGSPLIMLGGGTTGAAAFAPHAKELAGEFHVIRLQTLNVDRAHTLQRLPSNYSIRLETQCMRRSIDRLNLNRPIDVVGHSLGALIALDFALNHPSAVRSLVLSEPPAFWVIPASERNANPDVWKMIAVVRDFEPSVEPTDEHLVAFMKGIGEINVGAPADNVSREKWNARRRCLRGLSAVVEHVDDVMRLAEFRKPVMLVHGSETALFHQRINERLAFHLPCSERLLLPGGHSSVLTARGEFLAELRVFLARYLLNDDANDCVRRRAKSRVQVPM